MNAIDVAASLGVSEKAAWGYLQDCDEVVEAECFVAILKGNTVHLAANVKGLGGRRLVRECRKVLHRWYDQHNALYVPIRHGNDRAVRLGSVLGFLPYAVSDTHVWLMQTKEKFNGH